jgi:hypothetical protein
MCPHGEYPQHQSFKDDDCVCLKIHVTRKLYYNTRTAFFASWKKVPFSEGVWGLGIESDKKMAEVHGNRKDTKSYNRLIYN